MKKKLLIGLISLTVALTGCKNSTSQNPSIKTESLEAKGEGLNGHEYFIDNLNYDNSLLVKVYDKEEAEDEDNRYRNGKYYRMSLDGEILNQYPENLSINSFFEDDQLIAGVYRNDLNKLKKDDSLYYGVLNIDGSWLLEPEYVILEKFNKDYYYFVNLDFKEDGSPKDIYHGVVDREGNNVYKEVISEDDLNKLNLYLPMEIDYDIASKDFDLLFTQGGYVFEKDGKLTNLHKEIREKFSGSLSNPRIVGKDVIYSLDNSLNLLVDLENLEKKAVYDNNFVSFIDEKGYEDNIYWSTKKKGSETIYELKQGEDSLGLESYDYAPKICNDRMIIQNKDKSRSIADRTGKLIGDKTYKNITSFNTDGFALAETLGEDSSWVVIDKNGKLHIDETANIGEVILNDSVSHSLGKLEESGYDSFKSTLKRDYNVEPYGYQFVGIRNGKKKDDLKFGYLNLKDKSFVALEDLETNLIKK